MVSINFTPVVFTDPVSSGSGIAGPSSANWSVADDGAATGNILTADIVTVETAQSGYEFSHYEYALAQAGAGVAPTATLLLGGAGVGFERRLRCTTAGAAQRVYLRTVQNRIDTMIWNPAATYTVQVGDTITQGAATGTVTFTEPTGASDWQYVTFNVTSGAYTDFVDEGATTINGNSGTQKYNLFPADIVGHRTSLKSEWSTAKSVTPTTGSASITLTASKTTCLQGEGVYLQVDGSGFDTLRGIHHECDIEWTVAKAGEAGTYAALPTLFESAFGSGSNDRRHGNTRYWAFAPITTGTVTISCTVRDRSGNSATNTIDLTSVAPASSFAAADVYAASSTSRAVPGVASANIYTDLATLAAALPSTGEALVLLDTADTHGSGLYTQLNWSTLADDRLVVMPYNGTGIGVDAAARATINQSIRSESDVAVIYGIDMIGEYDQTDPFSITDTPEKGLRFGDCAHYSAVACNLEGWDYNCYLPSSGNTGVFIDIESTNWFNFGFHTEAATVGKHVIAGSYLYNKPGAWRKAGKQNATDDNATDGYFTDHGPYRCSRPGGERGMCKTVAFTSVSWGGVGFTQYAWRFFGSGFTEKPYGLHGNMNYSEAGRALGVIATSAGSATDPDGSTPQDFVWENFYHLNSLQPPSVVSIGFGGVTIRNGMLPQPQQDYGVQAQGLSNFITTGMGGDGARKSEQGGENDPVVVEFCSMIDLRDDTNSNRTSVAEHSHDDTQPLVDVTVRNGMLYAPNLSAQAAAEAADVEPLTTTTRFTPLYAGKYDWDDNAGGGPPSTVAAQTPDLTFALPATITATFEPTGSGSNAWEAATGSTPYRDILQRVRPSSATLGAFDPNAT